MVNITDFDTLVPNEADRTVLAKAGLFVLGNGEAEAVVLSLAEALDADTHGYRYVDAFGAAGGKRLISLEFDGDDGAWKTF